MGNFGGDYTVDGGLVFDENRQMVTMLQQQKSPIVDVLLNTAFHAVYTQLRRLIQSTFKNGTPFGAFTIEAMDVPYDFKLVAGTGSYTASGLSDAVDTVTSTNVPTGPARFYVGGHVAILPADRDWKSASVVGSPEIHSTITSMSADTIEDTSAFFGVLGASLVGKYVAVNIDDTSSAANTPKLLAITSYTATTLTLDLTQYWYYNTGSGLYVSVPLTAVTLSDITAVGNYYRIEPSNPGGARADSIYLDVYLDEMDSTDDPIVQRAIGGVPVHSANFGYVKQRLEWLEDYNGGTSTVAGKAAANNIYEIRTDSDGNVHHRVLLAVIAKESGNGQINTADITLYNNDPLWGLTIGSLPKAGTGAIVDGTASAAAGASGSTGSNATAGSYNGATLDLPNLLLQMLGNVTDNQNKAFQNMGDYNDGANKAGAPGKGDSAATSMSSERHIALVTNQEQAAISNQDFTASPPTYTNPFITIDSHRGNAGAAVGSTTTKGAEHSNQVSYDSLVTPGSIVECDSGARQDVSSPPAPILLSYIQTADGTNFGQGFAGDKTFNTGINISGYTIGQLRNHYHLIAIPVSRCSVKDNHMELTTSNLFSKGAEDTLLVTMNVHQDDDEFHMGLLVIGLAKVG